MKDDNKRSFNQVIAELAMQGENNPQTIIDYLATNCNDLEYAVPSRISYDAEAWEYIDKELYAHGLGRFYQFDYNCAGGEYRVQLMTNHTGCCIKSMMVFDNFGTLLAQGLYREFRDREDNYDDVQRATRRQWELYVYQELTEAQADELINSCLEICPLPEYDEYYSKDRTQIIEKLF